MTAEFNITIPGAEIIKRLADLETANADLLDRLKQLELTVSANAHQQDALHDRFIALERNNESTGAYIQRVETSAGEDTNKLRRALDTLRTSLNDFLTTVKPNLPANDPEPPVDTSWHPYDVLVDGVVGNRPPDDKHVVVMLRNGEILPPDRADFRSWDEIGFVTIVAWRYAKEGE